MERASVIIMLLLLPVLIVGMAIMAGRGDSDEHEFEYFLDPQRKGQLKHFPAAVVAADNPAYLINCSDCHLAYSANLLPARSWKKLMDTAALEDHFGEYVFLEEEDRLAISDYLTAYSAETSPLPFPRKVLRSIPADETPIRIREVRAVFRRHDNIPNKYTVNNQKVLSLSQCNACHQQSDQGIFDKRDVFITYEKKAD